MGACGDVKWGLRGTDEAAFYPPLNLTPHAVLKLIHVASRFQRNRNVVLPGLWTLQQAQ